MQHRKTQHLNEIGRWAHSLVTPSVSLMPRRFLRVQNFRKALCMPRLSCAIDAPEFTTDITLDSFSTTCKTNQENLQGKRNQNKVKTKVLWL